ALGQAAAAELPVREPGLEVAGQSVLVEAVPVPHGVRVVLTRLPAHGVFLLHLGVLEVASPAEPAAVVAGDRVEDRAVGEGSVGRVDQEEYGCGQQGQDAERPAGTSVVHARSPSRGTGRTVGAHLITDINLTSGVAELYA